MTEWRSAPASVSGCRLSSAPGEWSKLWHVTLPLLIASFTFNFNNFNVIYLFNFGNPPMAGTIVPMGHTDILISFVYRLAFVTSNVTDYGLAAAITVMLFILVGVMVLIQMPFCQHVSGGGLIMSDVRVLSPSHDRRMRSPIPRKVFSYGIRYAVAVIPAAWQDMNDAQLVDAVYDYTYNVLIELHAADLTPAFVQLGNETNGGILKRGSAQNWSRDAALFNAGIRAVRAFSADTNTDPLIILHVAQPENTDWWFSQAEAAGITDFDVIGMSYYPQWSTFSIADTDAQVNALRRRFGKDVMIVEAAYPWTRDAVDESAGNILAQGMRGYPVTPQG